VTGWVDEDFKVQTLNLVQQSKGKIYFYKGLDFFKHLEEHAQPNFKKNNIFIQ